MAHPPPRGLPLDNGSKAIHCLMGCGNMCFLSVMLHGILSVNLSVLCYVGSCSHEPAKSWAEVLFWGSRFMLVWLFFCQDHKLTWPHVAQVKRISGNGQEHSQSKIIISPSLHHLSKSDFRHHLILPVLISLSSLDLCFHSSPVIVIVKSYFDI